MVDLPTLDQIEARYKELEGQVLRTPTMQIAPTFWELTCF